MFLHGWGGDTRSFYGLAGLLQAKCRCILLDFYGFGDTPHPPHALTLDDYVEGVREVLRERNVKNAVLIGHSFGGRVAIKLAADAQISQLVLIDSAGVKPRRTLKYYYKVYTYKFKKRLKMDVSKYGSADYKALSPEMRQTFINVVNEDLTPALKHIIKPTLLLWGENDQDTPLYMAKRMHKEIRDCGLVVFPDCGHYCYLEKQMQSAKIIDSFIKGGADHEFSGSDRE